MEFYKKILIACVIIVFTYIIWRLIKNRQTALNELEKVRENFDMPSILGIKSQSAELSDKRNNKPVSINNASITYLPLIEYCIKGSYNSAFTGKYVNKDMITYLLSRGCRFLDLEIYYIMDKVTNKYTPQVGYSTDPKFSLLGSENSILLDTVFTTIITNAFAALSANSGSPNNKDPIFINLRIKSTNNDVYDAVAKSIDNALKPKLYSGSVTNQTALNDVMGQIVIIMDKTINMDYAEFTGCGDNSQYDLTKYINMESGSETLNIVTYLQQSNQCVMPINILDNNFNTDVKRMKLAYPDLVPLTKTNPIIREFITQYGCQIVPNQFYYNDDNLEQYEKLFNEVQSAFIPLSIVLRYYRERPYTV
jgi:hypothetical protein